MNIRYHDRPHVTGHANQFNTHAASEVFVYFQDGDSTSEFVRELDVQLPDGTWKPMKKAFSDKDIIPDNFNRWFGPPNNADDKERGYI